MASGGFFRQVRITLLLVILVAVGMNSWLTKLRSTDWDRSLWMVIYPVNGDGSEATQRYMNGLSRGDFSDIGDFLRQQAQRYAVDIDEPVSLRLAPQVAGRPPMPPVGANTLQIMLWSLQLRFWALTHDPYDGPSPDIRMYVVYHDPEINRQLRHSLGIQKGMIGVVNAYASPTMATRNNVVVAHEFLHTIGATDKYNPADNQPVFPDGYAEPAREPRYPQRLAEIMGGRIPLSPQRATMPGSLANAAIGELTAREIRWLD
jgi:hypothetical protein